MDPIGATASIITLLDVALDTFNIASKVIRKYRKAPTEILSLKIQLNALKTQLMFLRNLYLHVSTAPVNPRELEIDTVQPFLLDSIALFSSIKEHFEQQNLEPGKARRLRWVLYDAPKVLEWETSLVRHSTILTNILALLEFHSISLLRSDVEEIKTHVVASKDCTSLNLRYRSRRFKWFKNTTGGDWSLPIPSWIIGSIYSLEEEQAHTYRISLRGYTSFWLKAFCVDLNIRRTSMFTGNITAIGRGLQIKNLVPESSPIITACKLGNITTVWELFQSGQASINDITPENQSLLRYAIQSGNVDLVLFLISRGADVKETFGSFQSTPLQIAFAYRELPVARALLAAGAETYHINAKGWAPCHNLFGTSYQKVGLDSSLEYLQILSAASAAEFEAQDGEGWSCMHRAVAYGNAEDIKNLIDFQAPYTLRTSKLLWTPIFVAAQFGNMQTFNELRKHHPDLLDMKDIRGWTLLHVAVNAKRTELIRLLVSLGADPHACSRATKFLVPDDLKEVAVTTGDIAMLRGKGIFDDYVESLRMQGYELEVKGNEPEEEREVFWPSVEKMEILGSESVVTN